jgi:prepilin-type N-terminal cleavage/methylation domain-containing protein
MKSFEHNKGFTLIEVMIAIVILTIGLLALVSVTVMVIKGNSLNKMITTATTIAKDQMETLKNSSQISFNNIGSSSLQNVTGFPGYQWQQTVDTITGNSSCTGPIMPYACCTGIAAGNCPDKKNVAVEVHWQWQGSDHNVTLNTIVTKK